MEERHFIDGGRTAWERLAKAVEDARAHGVTNLSVARLRVMHDDYRRTTADLAYSQTHYPQSGTTDYLNALVSRAHGELYGSRKSRTKTFVRFVTAGYPSLVRRYWRFVAVSGVLLFGAAAVGYLLAFLDYSLVRVFVPDGFQQSLEDAAAGGFESDGDFAAQLAPAMAALVTTNNIQVALTAFAGGVTAGVLTVWALVRNGLLLGGLAGMWGAADLDLQFWALIIPHGGLELLAIVIAGASGLLMGRALISPGDAPRLVALRRIAPDAVRLVLGTIPLFIVAGLIEGFFTPGAYDPVVKIIVGVVVLAIALLYLAIPGRARA